MNIAFYTAPHLLRSDRSDSRYVYEALKPHFCVDIFSEPDADLSSTADVVFTRFPLPIDTHFLRDLERHSSHQLIINSPQAQLHHSKRHLLLFPQLTAPTLISASFADVRAFSRHHGVVVFKPLDRHKGVGVTKIDVRPARDDEFQAWFDQYVSAYGIPVVQQYISSVLESGDKRINIIAGRPVSAVTTLPAPGSFICHEAMGGSVHAASITHRDEEIIESVLPFLKANRVFWAALDIIGPYLGEINILTPAMVWRADQVHNSADGANTMVSALKEYERGASPW